MGMVNGEGNGEGNEEGNRKEKEGNREGLRKGSRCERGRLKKKSGLSPSESKLISRKFSLLHATSICHVITAVTCIRIFLSIIS